jgi:inosine-uridine nucleoside N-ribohydrolase
MRIAQYLLVACAFCPSAASITTAQSTPRTPQLAIIDTDIGDDIDDAFALALALRSPELHMLGITTAYGDTDLRAHLVDRFLAATDCGQIPVIPGKPTPQSNVFTQAAYAGGAALYQACLLDNLGDPRAAKLVKQDRTSHDAAGYLLRQIKSHPNLITLIAIGPLFNVQAAIEKDPATFKKLKRVVIMGGSIERGYDSATDTHRPPDAEWNINRDPAGLRALLASGVPAFVLPLDSTQVHLETPEREKIFSTGSPLTDQLTLLYHQWMAGADGHWTAPTLFDPVAVTYAIRPDLCPMTPIHIDVDDKGFTRRGPGDPNAQVCLKSDEKAFLDLLVTRLTAAQ